MVLVQSILGDAASPPRLSDIWRSLYKAPVWTSPTQLINKDVDRSISVDAVKGYLRRGEGKIQGDIRMNYGQLESYFS